MANKTHQNKGNWILLSCVDGEVFVSTENLLIKKFARLSDAKNYYRPGFFSAFGSVGYLCGKTHKSFAFNIKTGKAKSL